MSARPASPNATRPLPRHGSALPPVAIRWIQRLVLLLVALVVLVVTSLFLLIRHYESDLPSISEAQAYRPPQVTRVLAKDGTLLAELFTERRTVVPIEALPAHVKIAVLAAEDARFYEHEGVNLLGIVRAMVINLRSGRTRQGASTITQQVVKNILLDSERSYRRKIREALLARRLEQNLTKDKILELYLNQIYLGHGRYGVEEASRFYFGSGASEISLPQAATLAGLIASPESFSPKNNPERSAERRRFVLGQMLAKGFINQKQHDDALSAPVALSSSSSTAHSQLAPEAVEIAKKTLRDVVGDGAALGGYTIYTTIDPQLQAAARKAVQTNLLSYDGRHKLTGPLSPPKKGKNAERPFEGMPKFSDHKVYQGEVTGADDAAGVLLVRVGSVNGTVRMADYERYNPQKLSPSKFAPPGTLVRVSLLAPEPQNPGARDAPRIPLRLELGPQSALVAIDVRTREVLAIVGNYEAASGALDRSTQARRQPGSTFKPVVYSYAFHTRRFTPSTLLESRAGTVAGYQLANYDDAASDQPVRLREAVARSINVAAVHVAKDVGPANVVSWGRALGITSNLGADLSLALGSYEISPIEMANAYATFAGGGMFDTPRIVLRITDSSGKELSLTPIPPSRRVMDENVAYLMTNVLQSVVDHGTATRAKRLGRPVAGKTGTSNKAKDTWFVGYSTDISCAVWTGYDDAISLGRSEAGATAALPAWIEFMDTAHKGRPRTDFPRPSSITVVRIDPETGLLAYPEQQDSMEELFLPGTEPVETAEPDAGAPDAEAESGTSAEPTTVPVHDEDAGVLPPLPPADNPVPLF